MRCCSEKGYLVKDSIVLACEILECTPWLEFGDADLTFSDSDAEAPLPAADPCDHWPRESEGDAAAAAEGHLLKTLSAVSGVPFAKQAALAGLGDGAAGATVGVPSVAAAKAALHSKLAHDDHLLVTVCASLRGFLQVRTAFHPAPCSPPNEQVMMRCRACRTRCACSGSHRRAS